MLGLEIHICLKKNYCHFLISGIKKNDVGIEMGFQHKPKWVYMVLVSGGNCGKLITFYTTGY